jgi:hypothetical protein
MEMVLIVTVATMAILVGNHFADQRMMAYQNVGNYAYIISGLSQRIILQYNSSYPRKMTPKMDHWFEFQKANS